MSITVSGYIHVYYLVNDFYNNPSSTFFLFFSHQLMWDEIPLEGMLRPFLEVVS